MIRKLVKEYKKWGLDINLKKNEYMYIGGKRQDLTLESEEIIGRSDALGILGIF